MNEYALESHESLGTYTVVFQKTVIPPKKVHEIYEFG